MHLDPILLQPAAGSQQTSLDTKSQLHKDCLQPVRILKMTLLLFNRNTYSNLSDLTNLGSAFQFFKTYQSKKNKMTLK